MTPISSETMHGSSVAIDGRAVIITGPSGSGKSDLALRLIDRGAVLISDDYTLLQRRNGALIASAPATIAGRMEVRGLGIIAMPCTADVPVALIIELAEQVERMPLAPEKRRIAGIDVPVIRMAALHASSPIKIALALAQLADVQ